MNFTLIVVLLMQTGTPILPGGPVTGSAYNPAIVYRSPDRGVTWLAADSGLPPETQVEYVETLGDDLYLGTENRGLFRKNLQKGDWYPIGSLNFAFNEKITGLFASGSNLYACIFRSGFYKSTDKGNTWIPMHNTLNDKGVRAVWERKNELLVGADSGIFLSPDAGKSWEKVFSEGQVTTLVEVNGVLFGGTYRGVIRSRDGGRNWEWVLEQGAILKTVVLGERVVALLMSGGILVSDDAGQSWKRMDAGLPEGKDVYAIIPAGSYYLCSHAGGISRSTDRGAHWEQVLDTPLEHVLDLTIANGIIYGGTIRRD